MCCQFQLFACCKFQLDDDNGVALRSICCRGGKKQVKRQMLEKRMG